MFLTEPNIILINGVSNSGKSYLLKSFLNIAIKKKIYTENNGLIFCGTKFKNDFAEFVNEDNIFDGKVDICDVLKQYMDECEVLFEKKELKPSFIIFDDIMAYIPFKKQIFMDLISTYRHRLITIYFVTQQCNTISQLLKQQTNHCFLFNPFRLNKRSIINLYESFGVNDFDNAKLFIKHVKSVIGKTPYTCCYIDMTSDEIKYKYQSYLAK